VAGGAARTASVRGIEKVKGGSRGGDVATARAFVDGLNTPTRAAVVRLIAPSLRFRTFTNPWVRYAGPARKDFVQGAFGTNCALQVVKQAGARHEVQTEVEEHRDASHPCAGGQAGTRAVLVFRFDATGHIATLTIRNH